MLFLKMEIYYRYQIKKHTLKSNKFNIEQYKVKELWPTITAIATIAWTVPFAHLHITAEKEDID